MGSSKLIKESYTLLAAPLQYLTGEVRYKHLRLQVWNLENGDHTYNKGGVTIAYRYLTDAEKARALGREDELAIVVGFAGCSYADNFDRKIGREISERRLQKSQVVITGEVNIKRLMTATDPAYVLNILEGAMRAQGLRLELCA